MIIRNKFNGYGFDGSRLCHDPVSLSIAATQAGAASSAAAAAAATTAATTAAGTTAAQIAAAEAAKAAALEGGKAATLEAGKTAALEASKKGIIDASMQQASQQAAQQGIAQAGTQATQQAGVEAAKQGIFSANPAGMPPTAGGPITPPAQPLPPAGNAPITPAGNTATYNAVDTTQLKGLDAAKFDAVSGQAGVPQNAYVYTSPTTTPTAPVDPSQSFAPFKSNVPSAQGPVPEFITPDVGLPAKPPIVGEGAPIQMKGAKAFPDQGTFARAGSQAADQGIAQMNTAPTSELMMKPTFAEQFPLAPENPLIKGIKTGLEFVKDNPFNTGMGLMSLGQLMNQPEEEDKDEYKNKVDMSEFKPSIPSQPSFTRSYEYQKYAAGGPVEQMAAMNSVGMNTGYPMANVNTPMYSNPMMQRPEATNVIAPSADAGVGAYSGEPRFAEGGLSAADRREYGLKTRGERAARNLTTSYEEMEAERQKEAARLMGERSDPGIVPRSRTQMMSSPFSAAMAEHARLGKKAKVPVVEMPKTNLGDIDTYMDIPIEAAKGGIMRSFSNGGPAFMGPTKASAPPQGPAFMGPTKASAPPQGPAFMGPVGSGWIGAGNYNERARLPGRDAAPAAPVMSAPQYNAPAQQAPYTPVSYQDNPSYQMSAQQPDMSGFYNYMNQQLANYGNYGYAAGGGITGDSSLGGYSDGGRLLKGPGDGVSDSIPAVIGKRQPARLADGEFVIPARIVSELGNGSTEAGARKLYAMMERVQATRKKSIGKKKVAVNSKADKHLPA